MAGGRPKEARCDMGRVEILGYSKAGKGEESVVEIDLPPRRNPEGSRVTGKGYARGIEMLASARFEAI